MKLTQLMNEGEEKRPLSNEVKKHFLEIVSTYNKYQESLDRKSDIQEIAETLGGITEAARTLAIHEGDDWFDKHTIKRNMSELEKLGKEFDKCAVEATSLDQRLGGLYEDMGNILSRYYKMGDITEEQMKERLGMNESVGCGCGGTTEGGCGCGTHTNESVNEAKFKVLASFGGYDLIEAPTEKDMIISKNGKKVGKLTKISKYLKDDIKSFINMVKSGKLGESVVSEANFGYKDSTASYINNHKDEYKQAEKLNKGNEVKFYDTLSQMEDKIGHPKFMIFLSNALRGYKVDMYKDPKIKNPQDAQEALFLLSK